MSERAFNAVSKCVKESVSEHARLLSKPNTVALVRPKSGKGRGGFHRADALLSAPDVNTLRNTSSQTTARSASRDLKPSNSRSRRTPKPQALTPLRCRAASVKPLPGGSCGSPTSSAAKSPCSHTGMLMWDFKFWV